MTRRTAIGLASLIVLLPGVASAKGGPGNGTIDGEGLAAPIGVESHRGLEGDHWRLVEQSGYSAATFGMVPDPMMGSPPAGELGPKLVIAWEVGGPEGAILQELYPYAEGGPVTYVAPGQTHWDGVPVRGGWYRASPDLLTTLASLGLSPKE
ncbi:MAG: hypothetical protein ACRDVM_08955, partial [Acidimicrobiia bacterium]